MPRLSVDLDLVFVDHAVPREQALEQIGNALNAASGDLRKRGFDVRIRRTNDASETKLEARRDNIAIKVEANTVIRGTVNATATRSLTPTAQDILQATHISAPGIRVFADRGKLELVLTERENRISQRVAIGQRPLPARER